MPDITPVDTIARRLSGAYFALAHRYRYFGAEHVPRAGPAILTANHQSFYDPVLIGLAVPRRVAFLGWEHFYNRPVVGTLMRMFGTVPVDLDAPGARAFATLLKVLERGGLCGIFPEGGRTHDGLITEPKSGVAALALRSGAPVIPVTISGAYRAWPRGRRLPSPEPIEVCFGEPVHLAEAYDARAERRLRREATYEIMLRIADGFARFGRPDLASDSRRRLDAFRRDHS
jgi:1-acyl-sn-glycerol-3-phosphate acyltransferase